MREKIVGRFSVVDFGSHWRPDDLADSGKAGPAMVGLQPVNIGRDGGRADFEAAAVRFDPTAPLFRTTFRPTPAIPWIETLDFRVERSGWLPLVHAFYYLGAVDHKLPFGVDPLHIFRISVRHGSDHFIEGLAIADHDVEALERIAGAAEDPSYEASDDGILDCAVGDGRAQRRPAMSQHGEPVAGSDRAEEADPVMLGSGRAAGSSRHTFRKVD